MEKKQISITYISDTDTIKMVHFITYDNVPDELMERMAEAAQNEVYKFEKEKTN